MINSFHLSYHLIQIDWLSNRETNFLLSPTYDDVGGRGTWHLIFIVSVANNFSHFFVRCGSYYPKRSNRKQILPYYQQIVDTLNGNIVVRLVPCLDYNVEKVL